MAIERDWYTTEEAARELGVAPSTIRNAAFRGVLTVEIVAPRVRGITRQELERYRAERLGKNWGARREGMVDEKRAAYYRDYRARKRKKVEAEKADEAEETISVGPSRDTTISDAASAD